MDIPAAARQIQTCSARGRGVTRITRAGKTVDTLAKIEHNHNMKALTVAEIKTHFSDVLVQVKNGENIKILYGKAKKPVAMIIPIGSTNGPRKIGILDGKTRIEFRDDFAITPEELVAIQ